MQSNSESLMKGFGSHNSGTGERSRSLLSCLVVPFARCQTKTIAEQYKAGVRYFDFRVRKKRDGTWCFAHGLWESKRSPWEAVEDLNNLAEGSDDKVYIAFTYEGRLDDDEGRKDFLRIVDECGSRSCIVPVYAEIRKPCWERLVTWSEQKLHPRFIGISGKNGNWWWPVPRYWKKKWKKIHGDEKAKENEWEFDDFV